MTRTRAQQRSAAEPPRVKVSGPEDFVAIVPYLLGFHPRDSLVALFLDDGRVRLTARFDLPGSAAGGPPMPVLADRVVTLAGRVESAMVVLVCYTDSVDVWPELDALVATIAAPGGSIRVGEAVQVSSDRWRSLICSDPGCCPAEGTAYDLDGHPLAAEAVFAGLTAVSDRSDLQQLISGPPPGDVDRLQELALDQLLDLVALPLPTRQRLMRHRVQQSLKAPAALSDTDCAELAALCVNLAVRDVAWAMMTRPEVDAHLALWQRVVSRTADAFAAGPLGLESIAAWLGGNGALLNCGIERLAEIRPDYGLLTILGDLSSHAVPPSTWESIGSEMRRELKLTT